MMGEFRVHHCRFFDFLPKAIHGLAYDEVGRKLAVSRSDGSIEIWSEHDNWFQEKVLPSVGGQLIEGMVWAQGRLFSVGLHGNVLEHDLATAGIKHEEPSNNGAIWCITSNAAGTQIAAGTEDGCVVLFDVTEEGSRYVRALDKQRGRILSLAWYEQDGLVITGGVDNIRIWSLKSGHAIDRLTLPKQDRNRETIVWSIAVTSDFTIISGDSRGKVCFWNGKQGTLIKSVQSHKADVLSLCVNKAGDSVFASGIDPVLVQFEFTASKPDSDWKMWVKSNVKFQHSHDVRAVCLTRNAVVSGGVDCQLILNATKKEKGVRGVYRMAPIPRVPLVCCAHKARVMLLNYTDYLEVWRLGHTTANSDKSGELLPLKQNAVKLLQLKCRSPVTAAALSDNGEWLVYSDTSTLRIFQLSLENMDDVAPKVSLTRIRFIPPGLLHSLHLAFLPGETRVVSVSSEGSLQVLAMDALQPVLNTTIATKTESDASITSLALSPNGQYCATADSNRNVHVYDLKKSKWVCSLPQYEFQCAALTFSPASKELLVAYCDQRIFEYCVVSREYSSWCRAVSKKFPQQWLERQCHVSQLLYHPHKPHQILIRDERMLCILDKSQPFPDPAEKLFQKHRSGKGEVRKGAHAFHICSKFKYLMHLDVTDEDLLVVVERPPMSMLEALPPPFKQKKFGT